ncbi:hypothetical protein N9N67_03880 [Bacteriovoracaceae bacterium]|nr:hypothetical protein [Bacteriovoracaceae bacterium]
MINVYRRKLRNCIRKDTFRYYLENDKDNFIWKCIENKFGPIVDFPKFNLVQIENEKFIMRKSMNEDAFTLIRKKQFTPEDEVIIHQLIGFSE